MPACRFTGRIGPHKAVITSIHRLAFVLIPIVTLILAITLVLPLMPTPLLATELEPGQPVPDLAFTTLDGKEVRLTDFRGRVVLAKLGFTW